MADPLTPLNFADFVNWGLAGLFAIFALVLVRYFLDFLSKQMDSWRQYLESEKEQRQTIMTNSQTSMMALAQQIQSIATTLENLQKTNNRAARKEPPQK